MVNRREPTGEQTFHASAQGGVRFVTGEAETETGAVAYVRSGSAGWQTTSRRAAKTNVEPVDAGEVLDGVEEMAVSTREYADVDGDGQGVRHIGPMAEDSHEVADVGDGDEHINSVNADGLSFAASKELAGWLGERTSQLRDESAERDERIDELREENERLRERLSAVEDRREVPERDPTAATDD